MSRDELSELACAVLNTPDGKKLIKLLEKRYILDEPVAPHFQTANFAYFREGENNIIRMLKRYIEE